MKYKERGLFDEHFRLEKLSKQKDPLIKLKAVINWEQFRPLLNIVFQKEAKGKGGRPSYDLILMFKILILQRYYNLSDDQMEYQILDRLSFMRFLGLNLSDNVPDSKTVWYFREQLTKFDATKKLFNAFNESLQNAGLMAHEGSIIDASFVEVPRQRNTREENKQVKAGIVPELWKKKRNKLRKKDVDARWTKKNNELFFGYKNHVKGGIKTKFVKNYDVTDACTHDTQAIDSLLDESDTGKDLYADSAYNTKKVNKQLEEKEITGQLNEKGCKNKKLTDEQIESNRVKSKTRARVEHIFGFIETNMGGSYIRCIGKKRATAVIGLMNLTYNMFRGIQIQGSKGISVSI